ncbi:flagellar assembly protein FliW [Desulfitibacter alkalitolerans]|uniref:flagellar assembly protein FliW n=1 Tax=Desulfitibacter alkalitolerans TaxID=264641 RepID=UPI0004839B92|nr:flagellar assembly protein FliW [Desulfitibacter alkalitolerans]
MLVKTRQFGEISIDDKEIITFPAGILAFEENRRFIIIPVENNPFFSWLQSIDEPSLSFLLIDPFSIQLGFYVDIDESLKDELEIKKQEDVLVHTIVTIPKEGFKKATTNLLAPIIINLEKKKAKQIVLDGMPSYIKYPLFPPKEKLKASSG